MCRPVRNLGLGKELKKFRTGFSSMGIVPFVGRDSTPGIFFTNVDLVHSRIQLYAWYVILALESYMYS